MPTEQLILRRTFPVPVTFADLRRAAMTALPHERELLARALGGHEAAELLLTLAEEEAAAAGCGVPKIRRLLIARLAGQICVAGRELLRALKMARGPRGVTL